MPTSLATLLRIDELPLKKSYEILVHYLKNKTNSQKAEAKKHQSNPEPRLMRSKTSLVKEQKGDD